MTEGKENGECLSGRVSRSDELQTSAAREQPWSDIVDAACGVLTKAGDRIDQLIERVNALYAERNKLRSIVIEMLAADDAMAAFLIAADPAALGEGEWDRQHKERAARRREAAETARAALAKAEGNAPEVAGPSTERGKANTTPENQ